MSKKIKQMEMDTLKQTIHEQGIGLGQMTQDTYGKPYLPTFLAPINS